MVLAACCAALTLSLAVSFRAIPLAAANPLLSPSTLPFGAPPFDKITDSDYLPAFEAGMREQLAQVAAIADNPAPPTFQNTVVALERSGQTLTRVRAAFSAVSQANTDPALQRVQQVIAPQLAAHADAIDLNTALFERIAAVYAQRKRLHLDPESQRLLAVTYQRFVHEGARLNASQKTQLRDVNRRLAILRTQFVQKLLAGTAAAAFVASDAGQLAGLPASALAAAAQTASARGAAGKWMLPLQNTTQQPALQSLSDRSTRQALFQASWDRTERGDVNDTRATIAQIAQLRAQKAHLLGFQDYASYALVDEMAKTPQNVQKFLRGLIGPTRAKIAADKAVLQAQARASGAAFQIEPYDWEYYAEQVREQKYSLNDAQVRPYFELDDVLHNGLFYAANQLYGITFQERHDIPVYQPDVRVFEVYDKDGSPLALMYFDFFKRDNKQGGAWMSSFVEQSKLLGTKPVVYNVENIPKPPAGQPVLLTFGEVSGIFHEFGHALNGFFANETYPSLSGTNTSRDFVEFPSQFNEHWALYPPVFRHFAFDYRTHAPMPQALMDKIVRAGSFDQGYALGEALAADELDMAWHSLPASAPVQDADSFETNALKASGTDFPSVPPRYRSSYFAHIWGSGYAAGYYAYAWSEMLDDDAFSWFLKHGGMTRANGQRFRDMILSRGYSEDLATLFRHFYGSGPDVRPMLKDRGLTP